MIGQTHITSALAKHVKTYELTGNHPGHFAFEASRGMGKTLLMEIAAEMFGFKTESTAFKQGTQMDKAVNQLRNVWRSGSVWIVDELHNLSIPNQMALKKLLEPESVYTTNTGDRIPIPNLVVFSAFTDRSLIDPELLDRFTLFRLIPYTTDERLDILQKCAKSKGIELLYDDAEMLATTYQSPRDLVNAIKAAVVVHTNGEKVSSDSIFSLQGKDSDGLDEYDRQALLTIADILGSGIKATLELLSDKLRLSPKATRVILSRLSSLEYVKTNTAVGRTLTELGWNKVDELRERINQPTI